MMRRDLGIDLRFPSGLATPEYCLAWRASVVSSACFGFTASTWALINDFRQRMRNGVEQHLSTKATYV